MVKLNCQTLLFLVRLQNYIIINFIMLFFPVPLSPLQTIDQDQLHADKESSSESEVEFLETAIPGNCTQNYYCNWQLCYYYFPFQFHLHLYKQTLLSISKLQILSQVNISQVVSIVMNSHQILLSRKRIFKL